MLFLDQGKKIEIWLQLRKEEESSLLELFFV